MKHTYVLIAALLNSPAPYWMYLVTPEKKQFRRQLYNFLCLKLRVTEPYLTKFLQVVQKWLPIDLRKSKLWFTTPFRNDKVNNEDSRKIAAKSREKLRFLTA